MMIMNGMPVTLYPGNRACTYNGTEWIVSQNTLTVDFNTWESIYFHAYRAIPSQEKMALHDAIINQFYSIFRRVRDAAVAWRHSLLCRILHPGHHHGAAAR